MAGRRTNRLQRRRRIVGHRPRPGGRFQTGHRVAAARYHHRRTATRQHALVRMRADHGDRMQVGRQRQQRAFIAQQHRAGFQRALRHGEVGVGVDRALLRWMVEQPHGEHAAQDARDHVVQPGVADLTMCERLLQRRVEVDLLVEHFGGRLLIQSGIGRLGGAMRGAPVGHHEARIAPVLLEYLVEQEVVLAGPVAIDLVVRAHHRSGTAARDRQLEGEQIGFAHGAFPDARVDGGARGLLVIQRVVFDRGQHVLALDAAYGLADECAGQQGILAGVLEVAAVARIALQVDTAGQHHIEAFVPGLAADHRATGECDLRVPTGRGREARGQRRGDIAGPHIDRVGYAQAGVALLLPRDIQPWDSRHVAGRADRAGRHRPVMGLIGLGEYAVDQLEFFRLGQLPDQRARTRVGRLTGIAPGSCGRGQGAGAGRDTRCEDGAA